MPLSSASWMVIDNAAKRGIFCIIWRAKLNTTSGGELGPNIVSAGFRKDVLRAEWIRRLRTYGNIPSSTDSDLRNSRSKFSFRLTIRFRKRYGRHISRNRLHVLDRPSRMGGLEGRVACVVFRISDLSSTRISQIWIKSSVGSVERDGLYSVTEGIEEPVGSDVDVFFFH